MTRWSEIRWKEKWEKGTLNYRRTRPLSFPRRPRVETQLWPSGQRWAHEAAVRLARTHLQALFRHERSFALSQTQAHTPVSWQSLRSYPNACGCSPGSLWGQTWRRLWFACADVGYSLPWWCRNDMIPLEANSSPPTVPEFVELGSIWVAYDRVRNDGYRKCCLYLLLQKPSHY